MRTYHGTREVTVRLASGEERVLKPGDAIPDDVMTMLIPTGRFVVATEPEPPEYLPIGPQDILWGEKTVSPELAKLLAKKPDA